MIHLKPKPSELLRTTTTYADLPPTPSQIFKGGLKLPATPTSSSPRVVESVEVSTTSEEIVTTATL